ncbi:hypothetical protein M011DRAFT_485317 [Sporormia fimetaria CBS 119925]|uniref:RING-type domain-containing protein n=1 Tax=Sporormia fimetaria CBS 119925 TaxID=1340428 RepID=A0A6A6VEH2_9PLEO|nr:hypothetical protein M011DRAFT_485317 [Sporormia fimetaria CBS 119925]
MPAISNKRPKSTYLELLTSTLGLTRPRRRLPPTITENMSPTPTSSTTALPFRSQASLEHHLRYDAPSPAASVQGQECPVCETMYVKSTTRARHTGRNQRGREVPVALPCGCVVGYQCVKEWVTEDGERNCPVCGVNLYRIDHEVGRFLVGGLALVAVVGAVLGFVYLD